MDLDVAPSESQCLEQVVNKIKKMGRKATAITCDASKEDEVEATVEQTGKTGCGKKIVFRC
jgi:hypothetical protein